MLITQAKYAYTRTFRVTCRGAQVVAGLKLKKNTLVLKILET